LRVRVVEVACTDERDRGGAAADGATGTDGASASDASDGG
jgi:hypothetical protein